MAAALVVQVAMVAVVDVLVFSGYLAAFLTLPGTLLWRRLGPDRGRPFFEDAVLGTVTGLALELPVYLLGRAVGAPWLVVAVPVVALGYAVGSRDGRSLWYHGRRTPPGWAWAIAAVLGCAMLQVARGVWSARPVTALRSPYIDEPFHVALAAELKHHMPPESPWVDGVPLFYHWLVYGHLASASTVTGVEPVVLLRGLSISLFVALTILGLAAGVSRLTNRAWPGLLAAALLALGGAPDIFGWTPMAAPFGGVRYSLELPFLSPTHAFATALAVPLLVLLVEAMRDNRVTWQSWAAIALLMVAVSGAKSSTLPPLLAGLLFATVTQALLRTGRARIPLLLLTTATAVFLLAQRVFYGGNTRSLEVAPLDTARWIAEGRGLTTTTGDVPFGVEIIVAGTFVVALLLSGIGIVGLATSRGWRLGEHQFLVGAMAAAVGAVFTFGHPGKAQMYFLNGAAPVLVMLSVLGISRLVVDGLERRRAGVLLGAGLAGALASVLVAVLSTNRPPRPGDDPVGEAVRTLLLPQVVAVAVLGLLALGMVMAARRRGWSGALALAFATSMLLGLSFVRTAGMVAQLLDPSAEPAAPSSLIGRGGVEAARFLRDHSDPDELVATNAHCAGLPRPDCDRRNFWIAGYTERRVLVEGWAYIAPEVVGVESTPQSNSSKSEFWDLQRLTDNDAAFIDPTAESVGLLADEYDVRWLFVDKRFRHDLRGLKAVADLRFQSGRYAVFEVRQAGSS
jgi:hypothetical protein